MRIGTNVAAIIANNSLQKSQNNLSTSIERLSSGYKINGSKDDAAGCAISERMRVQLRGLDQAENNTADGISVISTAEGAINEIQNMLARMKELSVQAANDVNSDEERAAIQDEIVQINKEIDRISAETEF
ncbi:MAG: flagellar biosynthesis protein FlgL, partial [Lachnospira sp.]|nr:flagellar biosynthesis protein FlgL [Lachnospira sp.]